MAKVLIIYWSGTGNTEKMAELIAQGAQSVGAQVDMNNVALATPDMIDNYDIIALGSPSMGVEVIEEDEMEPFVEDIKDKVSGKKLALFGSYDWGDGEWLRNWEERMTEYGAQVVDTLAVHLTPEGETEQECISLGVKLASI